MLTPFNHSTMRLLSPIWKLEILKKALVKRGYLSSHQGKYCWKGSIEVLEKYNETFWESPKIKFSINLPDFFIIYFLLLPRLWLVQWNTLYYIDAYQIWNITLLRSIIKSNLRIIDNGTRNVTFKFIGKYFIRNINNSYHHSIKFR